MDVFAKNRDKCSVRLLTFRPGCRLSYQKHYQRDELFVALDDGLVLELEANNGKRKICHPRKGDYIFIPSSLSNLA
jgi:quercetin dioxygenase-like cupin family protein